jgi:drug/metabolite transporter (DMT)-like permease
VSVAAVVSWPLALMVEPADVNAGWDNWLAVVGLGLGPTAFAQALYMLLIARTSATFLSLTGYAIPVVAAVLGFVFFGELQSWQSLGAFAMILGGVWLARHGGGGRKTA